MISNCAQEDPLFITSKILAINPPNRLGRIHTTVSCVVLLALTYGVVLFFNDLDGQLSILVKFSLWLQLLGQTIIVLTDFARVLTRPNNFASPAQQLKNIEATLECFGFTVDDKNLRNRLGVVEILLSFAVPFGFGFLDLIDIVKGKNLPYLPIYFFHYVYALAVINVTEFLFVNYLHMIKRRFKELNRLINEIGKAVVLNRDFTLNKNDDEMILGKIHIVKKAHYHLFETSKRVNEAYGLHLLLSMTFSIILITEQLYQNYEAIKWHGRTVLESIYTNYTWTGYHITRISLMIFACYFTCAEANRTASLIHAIPIKKVSEKLKDEIFHFSLQIQEKLSFTAAGFFEISLNSFTSATGAVVTYLIIMIQMGSGNQEKDKNA